MTVSAVSVGVTVVVDDISPVGVGVCIAGVSVVVMASAPSGFGSSSAPTSIGISVLLKNFKYLNVWFNTFSLMAGMASTQDFRTYLAKNEKLDFTVTNK
jgi:hypothetical protein